MAAGAEELDRPPPAHRGELLETARPLSASIIWRAQDRYYDAAGPEAWASGDVPHTLTSGPMLGRAYARLIEAYAADCLAGALGAIDPAAPLYVVELGSGSGRLAFEVLHALRVEDAAPLRVVYLATDRVGENLAAIRSHRRLRPFLERGALEVLPLVVGRDELPEPLGSGVANPLVVIANYLFDVVPQDLYVTEGGVLYEEFVATCVEEGMPAEVGDRDFFRRIYLATTRHPVARARYGGGPIDEILAEHARRRPEGRFLFPAAGLRSLLALRRAAGGRLLSLIGERPGQAPRRPPPTEAVEAAIRADPEVRPGPASVRVGALEALRPGALLAMGVHGGSMSLPVDLAVLAMAAASSGSAVLLPASPPSALLVAALLLGEERPATHLRRAYRRRVQRSGPEDLYLLVKAALAAGGAGLTPDEQLAVLRVGGYDPYLLRVAYEALERAAEHLDPATAGELARVARRVIEHDFPLGSNEAESDSVPAVATLLATAGLHAEALGYFEESIALRGPTAPLLYNVALCELHLERAERALGSLRRALEVEGGYAPAQRLLDEVLGERARRSN